MKRNLLLVGTLVIYIHASLRAQYKQERLYPDLSGDALLEQVVQDFKADILFFTYGMTRDTMFKYVYGVDDSLSCVYSGHTLYMDPSKDPTTTVYLNGIDNGINTEHTYPQSKGASYGNARSDMHHLYPTRAQVNEERSNFPFGEIPDEKTSKWFYKDRTLLSQPATDIDKYSEWKWQVFEPRESFKGNIARAVMYFYTMYKSQADAEDPKYFWDMLPALCDWHYLDPVDSTEYTRSNLIAKWQQHPNPFILDCSLAARTYCEYIDDACALAVPTHEVPLDREVFEVYYSSDLSGIVLTSSYEGRAEIYNMLGQKLQNNNILPEVDNILSTRNISAGNYVIKFHFNKQSVSKIIYLP